MTEDPPQGSPSSVARGADGGDDVLGDVLQRLNKRRGGNQRYEIRREIARGGMGVILDIWDADLGRDLAMKVILGQEGTPTSESSSSADPRMVDRFLEEAQVTGQLDHPGIVPVHEIGLDDAGRLYFTMRLVTGRDLEKIFELVHAEKEGWTRTRAVGVLLKVCEAMAYAHAKGVIHRDLKPANIMVGRFGEVYVMDWGLARVLGRKDKRDVRLESTLNPDSSHLHTHRLLARDAGMLSPLKTMDGDIVGTPAYMSPEQARGDLQAIGPGTDVYAVGAILYHLLAAHTPYVSAGAVPNAIEVWRKVREGPPTPLAQEAPAAPPELVAICEKAMAREIGARYGLMKDLAEDLRAYLEGRVVSAFETGAVAVVRKWIMRNKALSATMLAATIIVLSGLVVHAFVLAQKNEELTGANSLARSNEQRAIANEAIAREQAAIASERADRILRLSDVRRLEELDKQADELWPADPAHIAPMERWLQDARALARRRAGHEQALEEIRTRARPAAPHAANGSATRTFEFDSTEDRWQHDTQQALVLGLAAFEDSEHGRIADVERRLEFAKTVEERSVTGADVRARWVEAIASVSDAKSCPVYAGLRIVPQIGLVPIGRDPHSGLWEFVHIQSGAIPERDAGTRELRLTPESGIVLVLVPGGVFEMGAQPDDPGELNYDPQALPEELPPHTVGLDPFFLSKYELTQGQWLRFSGKNPSVYGPQNPVFSVEQHSLIHPVEQVSWTECFEFLTKLGLTLPTEAQWEYAARAETTSPWWTGDEKESLEGAANLADQALTRLGGDIASTQDWPELDDGYGVHAPVDAFRPNPFGLHNVAGNVWEWCRDYFAYYVGAEHRSGDGESLVTDGIYRMNRGGGFVQEAAWARSSRRNRSPPETRANHLGVRPARPVTN